jgi:hypothetical protein
MILSILFFVALISMIVIFIVDYDLDNLPAPLIALLFACIVYVIGYSIFSTFLLSIGELNSYWHHLKQR